MARHHRPSSGDCPFGRVAREADIRIAGEAKRGLSVLRAAFLQAAHVRFRDRSCRPFLRGGTSGSARAPSARMIVRCLLRTARNSASAKAFP